MTIDEIFAALPEEPAQDAHEFLVIDPASRTIKVPAAESIFGVEEDKDSERKYFICPRYVGDNLDLAACFLSIKYRNANGEKDQYLITDTAVNGEYVTFSWLISEKVVKYKGVVQFRFDADTAAGPAWGTTNATGTSLEGMEPEIDTVEEETSDVVTQLRAMVAAQTGNVEAVGAAQVAAVKAEGTTQVNAVKSTGAETEAAALAAIEAKGQATLETIPEDYTALQAQADLLSRNRAAAIVCQAEGELLQIIDASDDPLQGLRIFGRTKQVKTTGKQLLPIIDAATKTDRGLTQTVIGGVCTVRGTANSTAAFNLTLYGSYYNTEPVFTLQPGTYTVKECMVVSSDGSTQKKYENTTFKLTEELGITWVATRSYQPGEVVAEVTHPMLNEGDTALPWEPYSGGAASPSPTWPQELQSAQDPVVGVCGKNLIPNIISKTVGGITFTANADGSFTVNGTADAYRNGDSDPVDATPYRGKTVTLSGKREFSRSLALQIFSKCASGNVFNSITRGNVVTFKIPEDAITISLQCYVTNGETVENVVIYPQLELGDKETDFEPYAAQSLPITTPNSLPGIPVASGGNYTDANGQEWVCDEVDLTRGVYVQRVGEIVFDGSQSYHINAYQQGYGYFVFGCTKNGASYSEAPMLCDKLNSKPWGYFTVDNIGDYICYEAYSFYISLADQSIQTVEAFQEYLAANPITALYILAKPVETPLTDVELQAFLALHSNKPTTTVLNDAGAHMVLEYAADPKTYIDNKLAALVAANN